MFQKIHRLLSFKHLLLLLLVIAIGVQIVVIGYNHYSGYYELQNWQHFVVRFLRGALMSLLAGFLIAYPDLFMIQFLKKISPWSKKVIERIFLQFLFAIILGVCISIIVTLFANFVKAYTEELTNVLINNAMIYSVVNVFVMSILEGWINYNESRQAKQVADILQNELSQIKFEVLKSQINPHFRTSFF